MMDIKFFGSAAASAGILLAAMAGTASAQERMAVVNEHNIRRTCPSLDCGAIGRFYEGESVVVYESRDGWSRVSRYYTAGCNEGRSSFVDSGADDCTAANGIRNGEFAEWIRSDFLAQASEAAS